MNFLIKLLHRSIILFLRTRRKEKAWSGLVLTNFSWKFIWKFYRIEWLIRNCLLKLLQFQIQQTIYWNTLPKITKFCEFPWKLFVIPRNLLKKKKTKKICFMNNQVFFSFSEYPSSFQAIGRKCLEKCLIIENNHSIFYFHKEWNFHFK